MLNSLSSAPKGPRTFRIYPDHQALNTFPSHRLARVDTNDNDRKDGMDHYLLAGWKDAEDPRTDFEQISYRDLHRTLKELGASEKPVKANRVLKALEETTAPERALSGFRLLDADSTLVKPTKQEFRLDGEAILYTAQLPAGYQTPEPSGSYWLSESQPLSESEPPSSPSSSKASVRESLLAYAQEAGWEVSLSPSF